MSLYAFFFVEIRTTIVANRGATPAGVSKTMSGNSKTRRGDNNSNNTSSASGRYARGCGIKKQYQQRQRQAQQPTETALPKWQSMAGPQGFCFGAFLLLLLREDLKKQHISMKVYAVFVCFCLFTLFMFTCFCCLLMLLLSCCGFGCVVTLRAGMGSNRATKQSR